MADLKIKVALSFLLVMASVISVPAFALDNPDTPNNIAQFELRARIYEQVIKKTEISNRELISAFNDYETFLDSELNAVYSFLIPRLSEKQQRELKKSQSLWLQYRDAEFDFISNNWTRSRFGSSAFLSRGQYRSKVIKTRVLELLSYAQNY